MGTFGHSAAPTINGQQLAAADDLAEIFPAGESRLQAFEDRYRQLLEQCPAAIVIADPATTRFVEFNDVALTMYKYPEAEFRGMSLADIAANACRSEVTGHCQRILNEGESRFETQHRTRTGDIIDVRASVRVVEIDGRKLLQWVCSDISDLKRAERQVRENEERLRQVIDSCFGCIGLLDLQGRVLEVNRTPLELGGLQRADVIGRPFVAARWWSHSAEVREQLELALRRAAAGESVRCETTAQMADGVIELDVQFGPLFDPQGRVSGIVGFGVDITDRKRAVELCAANEERFRAIFEQAAVGVAEIDTATNRFLRANSRCCEILGYSPDELVELNCVEVTHPDDRELHIQLLDRLRSGELRAFTTEKRLSGKGGVTPWVNITVSPMWPVGGLPTHHIAVIDDITERKLAQDTQRIHSQVLVSMAETVCFLDEQGTICFTNPALDAMFGYQPGELIGRPVTILNDATPEQNLQIVDHVMSAIASAGVWNGEFRNRRKDGTVFWTEAHVSRTNLTGNLRYVSVQQDVTIRRRAEEQARTLRDQLAHFARLTTMGELASGLAHEVNQPLTALEMYATVAQRFLAEHDSPNLQNCLQRISEQALRAGEIVRRMRTFIGRSPLQHSDARLNQLIRDVLPILESDWRQNSIVLILDLDETLPPVSVDTIQIQQVLVNLIRNAIEAMASTPDLDRRLTIQTSAVAEGVCIHIGDTGPGLDPAIASRLFHPFESTKSTGLGIGLAISRTLVEAHGGHLEARPNSERGMTFSITLPKKV